MCVWNAVGRFEIDFGGQNRLCRVFVLFDYSLSESIIVSRINSGRSKKILLSVRITFKRTTKHKSLYLKINYNQINFNKINSIKVEQITLINSIF